MLLTKRICSLILPCRYSLRLACRNKSVPGAPFSLVFSVSIHIQSIKPRQRFSFSLFLSDKLHGRQERERERRKTSDEKFHWHFISFLSLSTTHLLRRVATNLKKPPSFFPSSFFCHAFGRSRTLHSSSLAATVPRRYQRFSFFCHWVKTTTTRKKKKKKKYDRQRVGHRCWDNVHHDIEKKKKKRRSQRRRGKEKKSGFLPSSSFFTKRKWHCFSPLTSPMRLNK